MELEEMLLEMEPENPKMKVTKTESREMEVKSISELHDFINSMPEGMVASIKVEVWCHD